MTALAKSSTFCLPVQSNVQNVEEHRKYFDNLAKQLGINHLDDWYKVSSEEILQRKGSSFVRKHYKGSVSVAVKSLYPEHNWIPWRFRQVPSGFWPSVKNQRSFLDWVAEQTKTETTEDWYLIDSPKLKHLGVFLSDGHCCNSGWSLLRMYEGSVCKALITVYPEYKWQPWKYDVTPAGFWDSLENQRDYFEWLADIPQIVPPNGWYSLTSQQMRNNKGSGLLHRYEGSVAKALATVFPTLNWKPWKFSTVSMRHWERVESHKLFFDELAVQLGLKRQEDWYRVKTADVIELGAWGLINNYYGGSLSQAPRNIYPEFPWLPRKFATITTGYWDSKQNQKNYFEWLAGEPGIEKPEDWYKVKGVDVKEIDCASLLSRYDGSFSRALAAVYPEVNWLPRKFAALPRGTWSDPIVQRKYFDWIASEMKITDPEGWYNIKINDIYARDGYTLVKEYFNGSLIAAPSTVYKYDWQFWKFANVPNELWEIPDNQRKYLHWLKEQLDIQTPQDWNRVTGEHILLLHGHGLLKLVGGFAGFIQSFGSWSASSVQSSSSSANGKMFLAHTIYPSKTQAHLTKVVKDAFPGSDVVVGYRHPNLVFSQSKESMELDLFLPAFSLAFEYQGLQHFVGTVHFGVADDQKHKDEEKRVTCKKEGITLIEIPYWWDRQKESLIASIHEVRPDIISDPGKGLPIPKISPRKRSKRKQSLSSQH